jgi:hypothetical protein
MKKNIQAQCNENKHPGVQDEMLAAVSIHTSIYYAILYMTVTDSLIRG